MGAAIRTLPGGGKVYAGQIDDPFYVDLGSVFDLAGLRPFNPAHAIPLPAAPGVDGVGGFNTHTIALQVPIAQLTKDKAVPTGPNDPDAVLGIYATASRQRVQVLGKDARPLRTGDFVQVSRLANPLVNEVVIPLGDKDRWNASDPSDDADFADRYLAPEVTRLENGLYSVLDDAPATSRDDLAAILLTGVDLRAVGGPINLNFTGSTKADLIRLNTGIAPTAPAGAGNRLGVLAGDFAGFPNGRRLEDDVTDIELRAFACGYGTVVGPVVRRSASAAATPTGRRTTCSATASTRTTGPSTSASRTRASRTRATSTSTTAAWVGRRRGSVRVEGGEPALHTIPRQPLT